MADETTNGTNLTGAYLTRTAAERVEGWIQGWIQKRIGARK